MPCVCYCVHKCSFAVDRVGKESICERQVQHRNQNKPPGAKQETICVMNPLVTTLNACQEPTCWHRQGDPTEVSTINDDAEAQMGALKAYRN